MIELLINMVLLFFLMMTAFVLVFQRDLIVVVMLFDICSLLSANLFVILDAVDVAFTEAVVGAGISTVLILSTMVLTVKSEKQTNKKNVLPLMIILITGATLIYGTSDIPSFGDAQAPVHQHVAKRYIEDSTKEIGIPNMVTSILASYRGYDTLGEVTVIFVAGIGVLGLLGQSRRRRK